MHSFVDTKEGGWKTEGDTKEASTKILSNTWITTMTFKVFEAIWANPGNSQASSIPS